MGNCGSDDLKNQRKASSRSFPSQRRISEDSCCRNRSRTTLSIKSDEDLIGELFDQFDKDKDGYLDEKEIGSLFQYLCRRKGRSQKKIDENAIGSFLTHAGVMDEPRISKADFVNHFKSL